jgi:hypothetical protein
MVGLSICRILPTGIRLWIPSRRMALRAGRDYLGDRGSAPLVSGKKIEVAHSHGHGYSHRAGSALLYSPNLTERFFGLSSGEAGAILEKLRNYRLRPVGAGVVEQDLTAYFAYCLYSSAICALAASPE